MLQVILAAVVVAAPTIEVTPESLEGFSLQGVPCKPSLLTKCGASSQIVVSKPKTSSEAKDWFRYMGWFNYAACGFQTFSVAYRKDQDPTWNPTVGNSVGNALLMQAIAQTANMITDWIRRSGKSDGTALLARGATGGSCLASGWINSHKAFFEAPF